MKIKITLACDHTEAEQFKAWLNANEYDADIGRDTRNYVNGHIDADLINHLWACYCNGATPSLKG